MSDPICTCPECRKAGVSRPAVAPLGQTLHGRELEDWWQARDEFVATCQRIAGKAPGLAAAGLRLVKGAGQ